MQPVGQIALAGHHPRPTHEVISELAGDDAPYTDLGPMVCGPHGLLATYSGELVLTSIPDWS